MSPKNQSAPRLIDCQYLRPEHAAAYLIVENGKAAFIENNTARAVPLLLAALSEAGLAPDDVEYAIVTHIHLDHAGGTSALLQQCPNARVLVHPRGARHLVDPARLVASARKVYGDEAFDRLYAPIEPIPPDRVQEVADGETLLFGDRTLTFAHTRGHANHHVCIRDSATGGVFTGDTFGILHRPVQRGAKPFVLCSCPPTEFDPAAARETARAILDMNPELVYLTHYGEIARVEAAGEVLLHSIGTMSRILDDAVASGKEGDELLAWCVGRVGEAFRETARYAGFELTGEDMGYLKDDLNINAQGIAFAAGRRNR